MGPLRRKKGRRKEGGGAPLPSFRASVLPWCSRHRVASAVDAVERLVHGAQVHAVLARTHRGLVVAVDVAEVERVSDARADAVDGARRRSAGGSWSGPERSGLGR